MTLNLKRVENPILHLNLHMKILLFSFRSVRKYIENLVDIYDSWQDFGTDFWEIWYLFCKKKGKYPKKVPKTVPKGYFLVLFLIQKGTKNTTFFVLLINKKHVFFIKKTKKVIFLVLFWIKKSYQKVLLRYHFR